MASPTRREFILAACAAAAAAPALRAAAQITVGYAAITWGGNDVQAIEDVSSLGYKGIQLRSSAVDKFGDKPAELKALLEKHSLTMAVLSSGNRGSTRHSKPPTWKSTPATPASCGRWAASTCR